MIINGVTIDATFAEAFPMKATRAIITAQNEKWAMISAQAMTGFATSVIACGCEGGLNGSWIHQKPRMAVQAWLL
jgi:formylmethanofuran--tetrahydromethanopterin N-formyltransferase